MSDTDSSPRDAGHHLVGDIPQLDGEHLRLLGETPCYVQADTPTLLCTRPKGHAGQHEAIAMGRGRGRGFIGAAWPETAP